MVLFSKKDCWDPREGYILKKNTWGPRRDFTLFKKRTAGIPKKVFKFGFTFCPKNTFGAHEVLPYLKKNGQDSREGFTLLRKRQLGLREGFIPKKDIVRIPGKVSCSLKKDSWVLQEGFTLFKIKELGPPGFYS